MMERGLYHGGCVGCAQAEKGGTTTCLGCQYFDCNWSMPNMNDEHSRQRRWKESERKRLQRLADPEPKDAKNNVVSIFKNEAT